jgi:hypothetical protein
MLEGEPELTLAKLNEATQAWVELDYHRKRHSEIETAPLQRALGGPSVARPSPLADVLRRAFRKEEVRKQRRSDGTITIEGVRLEIPQRYRVLLLPTVRFARWDLSTADLVDARHATHLATLLPIDKHANADGRRRVRTELESEERAAPPSGIAPRLRQLIAEYAATGRGSPLPKPIAMASVRGSGLSAVCGHFTVSHGSLSNSRWIRATPGPWARLSSHSSWRGPVSKRSFGCAMPERRRRLYPSRGEEHGRDRATVVYGFEGRVDEALDQLGTAAVLGCEVAGCLDNGQLAISKGS